MEKPRPGVELQPRTRHVAVFAALILVLTAAFGLIGPRSAGAQDSSVKTDATIRVVNASPGSPPIDVLLNGQPLVQNLAFGAPSSYGPLKAGSGYKLQVVPTGQPAANAIAEKDFDVDAGQAYIASIVNPLKDIKINVDQVKLDAIDPGKVRVRFFQTSPDAGKVDLAVTGGDTWFGGVSQGDHTDYKDFDAGTYTLDVKNNSGAALTTASGLQLEQGHVYDIFATGQIADKTFSIVTLATIVSPPCASALNLQGSADGACVRFAHAAPGSPNIDVYVNGTVASSNLAFGSSTEFLSIPAGDSTKIQVTAAGGSLDKTIIDQTISVSKGQAYQFIATGTTDDVKLSESRIDLTPVATGQARVRLINASPDAGSVDLSVKNGDKLFGGVDYRGVTDYRVIDAKSFTLDVLKKDDNQILSEGTIDLKEPDAYDLVLMGRVSDQSLKILTLSAPATARTGSVATPAVQGTSAPLATVSSETTVSPTSGALTTPQIGASTTATVQTSGTVTATPQVVEVTVTPTSQASGATASPTKQVVTVTVTQPATSTAKAVAATVTPTP